MTRLTTGLLLLPSRPAGELAALARHAEGLGYDGAWVADERFFREVYACLTLCALHTTRIRLGPCVTDPYSRHAALTAMAIATLDEISGGRAMLGIGAGVSGFRELGVNPQRSAVAIREAVELIRRLLAGQTVTVKGDLVSFHDGRLDFSPLRSRIPIYVASQRPAGCRVAGRVAEGAIMQGCVAEPLLRSFRERVHEGARQAGRDPATVELVARLNVCVADDRRAARDVMRPTIVRSLVAQRPDFFTFATAGLTLPDALREKVLALAYTHDPAPLRAVAGEVPDEFVDALTLTGSPEEMAGEVARLARAGISQIMIYPLAPDGRIETTIDRFQREVMPRAREALAARP
ncbi:MAG: LLM class flavin-dependent oxidoreductase [Candidatus Rokubacteria bacterium]|nr:LLM class flavin-dependent oxidoreductase [Candidatus Rokubacteria bacterium]